LLPTDIWAILHELSLPIDLIPFIDYIMGQLSDFSCVALLGFRSQYMKQKPWIKSCFLFFTQQSDFACAGFLDNEKEFG